jgi:predicted transcriptional regulator
MTKYLLISIQPQHVYNILTGKKTLELRKMIPKWVFEAIAKCETVKALIYCTKAEPYIHQTKDNIYFNKFIKSPYLINENGLPTYAITLLNGKVVAQFDLNRIEKIICNNEPDYYGEIDGDYGFEVGDITFDEEGNYLHSQNYEIYTSLRICKESCVEFEDMDEYFDAKDGYAMFIKNFKAFDKPKALGDYYKDFAYSDTDEYGKQHNPTLIPIPLERAPQSMQKVWGKE